MRKKVTAYSFAFINAFVFLLCHLTPCCQTANRTSSSPTLSTNNRPRSKSFAPLVNQTTQQQLTLPISVTSNQGRRSYSICETSSPTPGGDLVGLRHTSMIGVPCLVIETAPNSIHTNHIQSNETSRMSLYASNCSLASIREDDSVDHQMTSSQTTTSPSSSQHIKIAVPSIETYKKVMMSSINLGSQSKIPRRASRVSFSDELPSPSSSATNTVPLETAV